MMRSSKFGTLLHRLMMAVLTALLALGSLVAFPEHSDASSGPCSVCRVAGADRYKTAVAAAQETNGPDTTVVYVAVGTNFPDAIAAGPAAAAEDAPILLVQPDKAPASTLRELERLDPDLVVVVGGSGAVSDAVLGQLAGVVPGATIERRWGRHRYDTAVEISRAAFTGPVDVLYVATGEGFADALIAAPGAVANGAPLLLVRPKGLHGSVRSEIQRLSPNTIVIVGGTGAVPNSVRDELKALAPTVRRISGSDRSALAANFAADHWPGGVDTAYVARADLYPDALAGGPMTRDAHGPILLVDVDRLPLVVWQELNRLDPDRVVILGGPGAVSSSVAESVDPNGPGLEIAISPGDSGPAVEYLQLLLTEAKLYRGPIDGRYPNDPWEEPGTMTSAVYAFHKFNEAPAGVAWTQGDHVDAVWTVEDWDRLHTFTPAPPVSRSGEPDRFEVDAHQELMWLILDGEVAAIFHVSVGGEFTYYWSGTKKYEVAHTPRGDLDVISWSQVASRSKAYTGGWMYRAWWYKYTHRWMSMHGFRYVPPYPASHGCVRVTFDDADWIYAEVGQAVGTPFHIWDS